MRLRCWSRFAAPGDFRAFIAQAVLEAVPTRTHAAAQIALLADAVLELDLCACPEDCWSALLKTASPSAVRNSESELLGELPGISVLERELPWVENSPGMRSPARDSRYSSESRCIVFLFELIGLAAGGADIGVAEGLVARTVCGKVGGIGVCARPRDHGCGPSAAMLSSTSSMLVDCTCGLVRLMSDCGVSRS